VPIQAAKKTPAEARRSTNLAAQHAGTGAATHGLHSRPLCLLIGSTCRCIRQCTFETIKPPAEDSACTGPDVCTSAGRQVKLHHMQEAGSLATCRQLLMMQLHLPPC
jgi:hypothetical protein